MSNSLKVGLIGLNANKGWASIAHAPAIRALKGLELAAVATRRQESADAAAAAFGIPTAYGDPAALISDPNIDVVAVTTRVPTHYDLIKAALNAGKHVLTEWPVAVTAAETEELAQLAERVGRRVAVGLQGRMSAGAIEAKRIIAAGSIGRVLYATAHTAVAHFGPVVDENFLYIEDPATGMNLVTILGGHSIDLATYLAGELIESSQLTTIQYPTLTTKDAAKTFKRIIPDHVFLHGRLSGGGAFAAEIASGRPPAEAFFQLDVVGDKGTLTLTGTNPNGFQMGPLKLAVDHGAPIGLDAGEVASLPAIALNTGALYAAFRNDIRSGSTTVPTLEEATRLARITDRILNSGSDQL